MQDAKIPEKRERSSIPFSDSLITDIPLRVPEQKPPMDLPSPRHRPGEPILYDPPVGREQQIDDPPMGLFNIDPLR